jgi:twinkle protein
VESGQHQSEFIKHVPCTNPSCLSSDANSLYTDGHQFCFSCNTYIGSDAVAKSDFKTVEVNPDMLIGDILPLHKRNISLESCQKWNYQIGKSSGEVVQIANYYNNDKKIVFQKLRFKDKQFKTVGNINDALLYGQNLWSSGGRKVCICEGEIDSISLSQLFGHKYPVVGIPNGVNGAVKAIKKQLEWLESFEEIVIFFDQDEHGQQAAQDCAELFTIGKCKIASFELKDVNDMLVANRGEEVIKAMWEAKPFRPDGILCGTDLWELIKEPNPQAVAKYPFNGLNNKLHGLRRREIVTICGGTGIGKTLFTKEIAYSLIKQDQKIGIISLEESVKRACEGIIGLSLNRRIHLDRSNVTEEELKKAYQETIGSGKVFLFNHWGSTEQDRIFNKIRYFANGLDCSFIVLDHVSILISGLEVYDERKSLDILFTQLRKLAEELNIGLIVVSHLRRLEGNKDHTDGVQVSLSHLRGSSSISQLSDQVISVERNFNEDENKNKTLVRVLKNRFAGITGLAASLKYNDETGRLVEDYDENFIF